MDTDEDGQLSYRTNVTADTNKAHRKDLISVRAKRVLNELHTIIWILGGNYYTNSQIETETIGWRYARTLT